MTETVHTNAPNAAKTAPDQQAVAAKYAERQKKDFEAAQKAESDRRVLLRNVTVAGDAARDRTLAVQEEISTRARDGISPGTAAANARHEMIRQEFDLNSDGNIADVPDRIEEMASRLRNITPSGCETLALEMAGMAAEMRGSLKPREAPVRDPSLPLTQQQILDDERSYRGQMPFMTDSVRVATARGEPSPYNREVTGSDATGNTNRQSDAREGDARQHGIREGDTRQVDTRQAGQVLKENPKPQR